MRLLVLISLFCLAACRDECSSKVDPGRCEGNTAINCPIAGVDQLVPVRWSNKACDTLVCIESERVALCVLDAGASPFCDAGARSTCDGLTRVTCWGAFETARDPCLSCDPDGGACTGGPSSKCAVDGDCVSGLSCRDAGRASLCTSR